MYVEACPSMTPAIYKNYERIRSRRGAAVAEVIDSRCSVCHITVRPLHLQDLKHGEQVLFCESCQRILYYNPPQNFEDLGGPSASAMPRRFLLGRLVTCPPIFDRRS
jgi:C4-type zinc ribbon domain